MGGEQLVVLTGPLKGRCFPIQERVSIGRHPSNAIQFDDLQISRRHAVIQRSADSVVLRDLGSANGTFIGGRRIFEYRLSPGEIVRIGNQALLFENAVDEKAANARKPPRHDDPGKDSKVDVSFSSGMDVRTEATDVAEVVEAMFEAPSNMATDEPLLELGKRLKAVYAANQIIASERDLKKLFHRILDQIVELVPAHNGVILLKDKTTGQWTEASARWEGTRQAIPISWTIVNRAFDQDEAILTYDAIDDVRFQSGDSIITHNIGAAMCVPLTCQDNRLGAIYVDTRGTANAFASRDLELLVALAGPAAIAIRNAQYVREIKKSYEDTLIVLANAIELRDHYTVGHTARVTHIALEIARELGWDEERLNHVRMGGVLHDVGKIAVDNAILSKPGRLTPQEYAMVKVHPQRGQDLLQDVEFLHPLIPFCLYHHERYDGHGYPFGLSSDKIPIEGRLIAVADTFDAMTSNRPYRLGRRPEAAIIELEHGSGTQFDPECVHALVKAYHSGRIDPILQNYHKDEDRSIVCPFCSTSVPISQAAIPGDHFSCHVCHRFVRIVEKNNAFYGELLPQRLAPTPQD